MKSLPPQADERIDVHTNPDRFQNHLHWQRYNHVLDRVDPGSSVLEIGTGLGIFSEMLHPRVSSYRGIEYDVEACKSAQARIGIEGLITQGDVQAIEFSDNSFDEVVCLEVLEHLPDYRRALDEIARVLSKGGKLHVSVPYSRVGGPSRVNPHHLYEPGEKELIFELQARFRAVHVFYQRYIETRWMTFARLCHLRRLTGCVEPYRRLTQGHSAELEKVVLDSERQGYLLGLYCECAT